MPSTRAIVALVAVALLLTGCAPSAEDAASSASPSPTISASPSPSPTPTPTPTPQASALVISLDGFAVVDTNGVILGSATLTEPDGALALLSEVAGAAPVIDDTYLEHKGFLVYEWPGVRCSTRTAWIFCLFETAEMGGVAVTTQAGIHVGSSRADVMALVPFEREYDEDGDGVSDNFGLDPREVPGTQSLQTPGTVGTDFVAVRLVNDVVTRLAVPGGDWRDI